MRCNGRCKAEPTVGGRRKGSLLAVSISGVAGAVAVPSSDILVGATERTVKESAAAAPHSVGKSFCVAERADWVGMSRSRRRARPANVCAPSTPP